MPSNSGGNDPPNHFITEPLRSFSPEKLENGDIRMAIAKVGQKAYSFWGEEATLTKDFLSKDFSTWDEGLVSINHENNNEWVKATLYNPEFDSESELVICSFSGLPEWIISLIYSEDYQGLSQECIPIKFSKNSSDVIRGFGTGVTIVTTPYTPAATQEMGVGIRPDLASILASKYPTNHNQKTESQIDDSMADKTGGGTPAISMEAFESTVSENVKLKGQLLAMETRNGELEKELASSRKELTDYKSGEASRTKEAVENALRTYDAQVKTEMERAEAVSELKSIMKEEEVEKILSTNPSNETIKSIAASLKVSFSKGVGTSTESGPSENDDVLALVSELRGTRTVVH